MPNTTRNAHLPQPSCRSIVEEALSIPRHRSIGLLIHRRHGAMCFAEAVTGIQRIGIRLLHGAHRKCQVGRFTFRQGKLHGSLLRGVWRSMRSLQFSLLQFKGEGGITVRKDLLHNGLICDAANRSSKKLRRIGVSILEIGSIRVYQQPTCHFASLRAGHSSCMTLGHQQ